MEPLLQKPDPEARRAERVYAALTHLTERHAATPELRGRHVHESVAAPIEVVRVAAAMAAGSVPPAPGEPPLDESDLVAALTLLPDVRAELDTTELYLLRRARAGGMTWQDIALSLGLGTPQAARQRYERLDERVTGTP
ncbi:MULTISPECIES: DNA-binding protein [Dactylosporangium]|uniref:DNA-binding protein n=1 Tax=Dactylosporangium vinaceum TaxID=53362 RepID=A0ABV5M247_9ACTN|nr:MULTISPECIES: DNA-binding protein [Dactylosporangium]UAB99369.1 DNA-binding protein [Dactylosporangium vinaceum]UWZ47596.1 DNA-binding protein [Dactylosporangium matsuzakiense]